MTVGELIQGLKAVNPDIVVCTGDLKFGSFKEATTVNIVNGATYTAKNNEIITDKPILII